MMILIWSQGELLCLMPVHTGIKEGVCPHLDGATTEKHITLPLTIATREAA